MVGWKMVIDELERTQDKSDALLLELINYQYGYIGFCMENNNKNQAKTYLKLAENNLEKLDKSGLNPSYVHAYRSAFHGFSIGINRLKGKAQYYKPPKFGGSKTEAIKYYKQAQTIMESDPLMIKYDWNYLKLLVNMAKSYTEMKEYDKADAYYRLILKVEPSFLLVKNELYPTFIKNRNNE